VDLRLTPAGVRIKRQDKVLEPELVNAMLSRMGERKRKQALRGLELLAEAAVEMIRAGDLSRIVRGGAR
jgi:DNA-binding MarR family transcriptional regulator